MIPAPLLERLQALIRQYDFSTFFVAAAALAAESLGADGAAFIVHEDRCLRYLFFHGLPASYESLSQHVFADDVGISGAALRRDTAIYTPDYPHSIWAMPEYVATGLTGSLAIPVHGPDGCSGILAVSWFRAAPAPLPDSDLHLAQLLADMLGAAWYRMGIEQHLERVATCDVLTGIPNRYQLEERIAGACGRAQRNERMLAIILLDLDGFKGVNDTMGHQAGDRLLREIVSRLQDVMRAGDTLVRYAGDEFVLLVENLRRLRDLEELMTRIMTVLNIRMGLDDKRIGITVSAGATVYPLDDAAPAELLHHADQALYRAKSEGGNVWRTYNQGEDQRVRARQQLRGELDRALQETEFLLYWQPIISLRTGRCVGAEALLRWQHPSRGLLLPGAFLDVAEDSPIMQRIGQWVMKTACRQGEIWHAEGMGLDIHINLAARQVENHRLCDDLRRTLGACPSLPPAKICLELVERIALRDVGKTARLIADCRSMGVHFALDDFGTGPAALQYLLELDCNQIKIDHSFVIPMAQSRRHAQMVQAMIQMAHALGVIVTAEGIEDDESRRLLHDMDAEQGQGFGIARPMPAGDFNAYLHAHHEPT
ncbi:putative bifunctional diguanylate cyclase/phosphodiesterase [Acidithiobacillus sp.]